MSTKESSQIDASLRQELIGIHQQNLLSLTKQRQALLSTHQRIPLILMNSIWYEEDELRGLTRTVGSAEDIARHDIGRYGVPTISSYDKSLLIIHHGNILHLRSEEKRLGIELRAEIESQERDIQNILSVYNR